MSTTSERPSTNLSRRNCPVCGASEARLIYTQRFEDMSAGLLSGYDIVICTACGAGFADGIPNQETFDAYYRDYSKYEYQHRGGEESLDDRRRLETIARIIAAKIPSREARILEIGCANGKLLALLKDSGFHNVVGLDPSPECSIAARKLYGIEVITNTIFGLCQPDEPFDFVIALGVLEHIRDVSPALARLRDQLAHSGLAFIAVPDAAHLCARSDAPFQEFSTEHINFFSRASLSNVMCASGFTRVWCESIDYGEASRGVFGVFANDSSGSVFLRDAETMEGLRRYIAECKLMDEELRKRIESAVGTRPKILVWGVGTHTRRLLANGVLDKARISAFVDSDAKYRGLTLSGIEIICPADIGSRSEPILISSYASQNEIANAIRKQRGETNQLILLYDLPGSESLQEASKI